MAVDLRKIDTQWVIHKWTKGSMGTLVVGTVADEVEAAEEVYRREDADPEASYVAIQTRYIQGVKI